MKLVIFLLASCLSIGSRCVAQVITFKWKDAPLENVFKIIYEQTGIRIVFTTEMLEGTKPVTYNARRSGIKRVLREIFLDQPLTFSFNGQGVSIRKKPVAESADKNIPVQRVDDSIMVETLSPVKVLRNGYQEFPPETAPGSFVYLSGPLFKRNPDPDIMKHLEGMISGLDVIPRNIRITDPTKSSQVIRGISTISSNARPLIVVDGFIYAESTDFINVIRNINPVDVESVTILRDAAAASIWGVRSGNGVIVITTRQGKYKQKTKFQFNSAFTIGRKPDVFYPPALTSVGYLDLEYRLFNMGIYTSAISNTTNRPVLSQGLELLAARDAGLISTDSMYAELNSLAKQDIRKDISNYLLQNSLTHQYSMTVSGGTNFLKYYSSLGFDHNKSNYVGNKDSRLTMRSTLTLCPIKKLEITTYLSYSQNRWTNNSSGLAYMPVGGLFSPYTRLADINGAPLSIPFGYRLAYIDTAKSPGLVDWHLRPLQEPNLVDNTTIENDYRIGIETNYSIKRWLSSVIKFQYQGNTGMDRNIHRKESYYTRDLVNSFLSSDNGGIHYPVPEGDILDTTIRRMYSWNLRAQLNFNKTWAKSSIAALAGWEMREVKSNYAKGRYYGYDPTKNTGSPIDYDTAYRVRPSGYSLHIPYVADADTFLNRYISYYANGGYTLHDKYTLSASARVDASNFFGVTTNQRFVPLWSVGALWNISQESFYKISWLPELRLRVSYGYNGNTNNSASAYTIINYESSYLSSNNVSSATIQSPSNFRLRWEKIKIFNVGVDFADSDRRVEGSLDLYSKKGIDLIGPVQTDPTTGVISYLGNEAKTSSKGIDFILNTRNTTGKFKWYTSLLFSYNADKVTSYGQDVSRGIELLQGGIGVGNPLYSVYAYRWAGLDPTNGDPRILLGDSVARYQRASDAAPKDIKYIGPQNPTIFGSIRNTFTWKNFSLSFNIIFKAGYFFRRTSVSYYNLLSGTAFSSHSDYQFRWQNPGDDMHTDIPSLPSQASINRDLAYSYSTILVERGDNIRLQDIRLSYNLPKKGRNKSMPGDLNFYIYLNNIGILWRANKLGIDPDYGDGMNGLLPPGRSITFGLAFNL